MGIFEVMVSKIFIIGIGPGNPEYLTRKAYSALQESDIIFGAEKVLSNLRSLFPSKKFIDEYKAERIFDMLCESSSKTAGGKTSGKAGGIASAKKSGAAAGVADSDIIASICFSGSINLYSGAQSAIKFFKEKAMAVEEIDGLSSISYFLSKINIPENEVNIVSIHGRDFDVLSQVRTHRFTAVLLSNAVQLIELVKSINPEGTLSRMKLYIGENLSLKDERITTGTAREFVMFKPSQNALSIALFENKNFDSSTGFFIFDHSFEREYGDISGKKLIPMTKENVRTLALEKLSLKTDSVLWDIGAGTGSVSIAAGQRLTSGNVYAFEKNIAAVNLCRKNIQKFELSNIDIIEGEVPGVFNHLRIVSTESPISNETSESNLPESLSLTKDSKEHSLESRHKIKTPTHAFIGGAGKDLKNIVSSLIELNPDIRIMITAVTLETISECEKLPEALPDYDVSYFEISVTDYEKAGAYHIRKSQNPVMMVTINRKINK